MGVGSWECILDFYFYAPRFKNMVCSSLLCFFVFVCVSLHD